MTIVLSGPGGALAALFAAVAVAMTGALATMLTYSTEPGVWRRLARHTLARLARRRQAAAADLAATLAFLGSARGDTEPRRVPAGGPPCPDCGATAGYRHLATVAATGQPCPRRHAPATEPATAPAIVPPATAILPPPGPPPAVLDGQPATMTGTELIAEARRHATAAGLYREDAPAPGEA